MISLININGFITIFICIDILRVTVTVAENGTLAETQRTRGSVPTVLNAGGDPIAQPIILGPLQMIEGTQPAFSNVYI